ncbi:hypothetical protein IE81DRAFT_340323 [Ceraceosorus guamensis]|uniref:RING-type domain-containing protein n=1 Tax=Ceraceosorus guamensis TaxID=1522189 RepID=A0A316W4K0_9BASI|nr:hypothetical protein IE81DRAFT_340323 [Ceraceosorus guamensis]PWN44058.1 hypothetical protein IE81DRAFT_340323 [Ceraceosorus guamensis]
MDDAGPASTPAGGRSPSAPPNPAEHVGTSAAGANFTRKRQSPSVQHNNMIGSGRRKLDPDSSVEFLAFTPATKRDTRSGQGSTTSGQLYPPAIAARSQDQASRLPTSMVTNPPRRTRSQSRNSHSPRTKLVALGSPSSDGKAKKQESLLPISDENEPKKVALAGKSHTGLARSASPSTSEKPLKGAPDSSSKVATSLGVHRGTTELELSLVRAEKEMESKNNFIEASRSIIENIHSMCTCTICLDLAWRPHVLTPCGHTFCARCLVGWFEKREPHESEPRASLTPAERLAFERRATQRRVKLCPHCRARVEARPAEVWMIKGFLDQLDSAVRSGHGRGGEDSTPSTRQDKGDDMPQGTDLWKHIFPEAGHNKLIHDVEDGVMRCGDCSSEVVRGICTNPDCALEYPEADDYTGSGGFSPYSDWDGQGNPFEIYDNHRLAARLFEHGLDDIGSDDEDEEDDDFIDDEERADHEAFMVEDGEEDEDEDNAIGSNAARRLAERRRNRQANRANNIQVISLDDSDEGGSSDVEMVQPSRSAQESGRSSSGGHGAGSAAPSRSDALSGQEPARADQDGRAAPSSTASESFDTARERDSANSTPIPGHPSSHSEQESSSGQAEDSDALSDVEEDEGFDLDQMRDDEQEAIFDEDNEDEPEEEDRE